jgi:hypothetical protein
MNILKSTTNTIALILTLSMVGFTAFGIADPKDFVAFLMMVMTYKFGRNQAKNTELG